MNRTTTVVVALIAAAGLSTMVYVVPAQRALAWGGFGGFGGCGFGWGGCGGFGGCGFGWGGCGGPFFVHKTIIQTIHQVNNCTGNGEDRKVRYSGEDHNQNQNRVVCLNTAVNTARHSFGGFGGFG
ncbi:MAG TPA: hypothetical protein VEH06_01645 [Candidatus Bathyarchaeia archaeon]|nr:hypothetical protein [Candidatus Bathyarchaeia archaeon]